LSISSQHDELVITQILGDCSTTEPPTSKTVSLHPHFGGKQPKQHKPPKCISVVCKEEKESLEEQLMDIQKELDDTHKELEKAQEELRTLKALQSQPSTTAIDSEKYGKLPRSVGMAKNITVGGDFKWCLVLPNQGKGSRKKLFQQNSTGAGTSWVVLPERGAERKKAS